MSNIEAIEKQRAAWNGVYQGWKEHADRLRKIHAPVSQRIVEALNLQKGSVVIDFGCGCGDLGQQIARQYPDIEVIGLDLSEKMVEGANETAQTEGLSNYSAQVFNLEESPSLPVEQVDTLVGQYVYMFLTNLEDNSRKLIKPLKSEGRVAFSVWGPAAENPWMTTAVDPINQLLELPKPLPDQPHIFRFAQQDSLPSLLRAVCLIDVEEVLLKGTVTFESPQSYFDFISQVAPPLLVLNRVSENLRQQARQAVLKAATNYIQDNQVSFGWSAWVISGTKP